MGLPIWKDPDEEKRKQEAVKADPTAAARSPIRRRPSVHGRRNTRLHREPTYVPSRLARSPPPPNAYNGLRSPRRSTNRAVPPVSTLLEFADRRSAVPSPPPRVEAPNDYGLPVVSTSNDRGERNYRYARAAISQERRSATRHTPWTEDAANTRARLEERMRTSPFSQSNDEYLSAPRARFISRDNTPFHRSPEPMSASDQAESPRRAGRSNLPTPPLEQSDESDSLFVPEDSDMRRPRTIRSMHPLSNSWRPDSPINGLGDRNRSPTPADGWEVMQTTITPDIALPSAESSFTSASASQSFLSNETALTEPDREEISQRRSAMQHDSDSDSETSSLAEVNEMMRDVDEREATAQYAQDMYYYEQQSAEGRSRTEHHRLAFAEEGNKFALAEESTEIELGFRLIDEALDSHEGRRRVFDISRQHPQASRTFEDWIFSSRRDRRGRRQNQDQHPDEEQPCPQQSEHLITSEDAAREANAQVHDYFRRFTAASPPDSRRALSSPELEQLAPPPPEIEAFISRDPPEPHPVSPPSARGQNEVGDLLLLGGSSGDEQDLNAVRRVVERLAQRDDVPDEWWMSMGLNLSRARVASQRHDGPTRPSTNSVSARARTGRMERSGGGSRL